MLFFGPLPAGGLAVGHRRKEHVSKREQRVGCPLTNPRGLQSERCGGRSPQCWYHKGDIRCVPRFLMKRSGGKRVSPAWPQRPASTMGLSKEGSAAGKDAVKTKPQASCVIASKSSARFRSRRLSVALPISLSATRRTAAGGRPTSAAPAPTKARNSPVAALSRRPVLNLLDMAPFDRRERDNPSLGVPLVDKPPPVRFHLEKSKSITLGAIASQVSRRMISTASVRSSNERMTLSLRA